MKVFGRVIVFVILPITVGCGLVHVIRTRKPDPNTAQPGLSPDTHAVESPAQPEPDLPVEPERPIGLDDYQTANLALPQGVAKWAGEARAGILVAPQRKLILWAKKDTQAVPIASMTKMMTMLVAFELMEKKTDLNLQTPIRVTKGAERAGGRSIWLAAGHTYPAETLLRTAMMYSANDASHAAAEGLAPRGDIRQFIIAMNRRARTLGMKRAQFFNVHGMPGKRDNQATPRDMVILALELQKYSKIVEWSQLVRGQFVHNNGKVVNLKNTNKDLLTKCIGVRGLKTGYTDNAGSCVTATCVRNGEFLIAVACGLKTRKGGMMGKNKRFKLVSGLFDWGFTQLTLADQTGTP